MIPKIIQPGQYDREEPALVAVRDLRFVDPAKIRQHRDIWLTFGLAINAAKNIHRDDPSTGLGGTYIQATEALHWLLSANSAAWLMQVNCAHVVPETLQLIRYRELFDRIAAAAKESDHGRAWLVSSVEFMELEKLVGEADVYFKAAGAVSVSQAAPVITAQT